MCNLMCNYTLHITHVSACSTVTKTKKIFFSLKNYQNRVTEWAANFFMEKKDTFTSVPPGKTQCRTKTPRMHTKIQIQLFLRADNRLGIRGFVCILGILDPTGEPPPPPFTSPLLPPTFPLPLPSAPLTINLPTTPPHSLPSLLP